LGESTAANALWETFLQGQNMPVAQGEWRKAADELGGHVRPIVEFLCSEAKAFVLSCPRKRASSGSDQVWIPACTWE
jgi:hypothetical protein